MVSWTDVGQLGVLHLKRLWWKTAARGRDELEAEDRAREWTRDLAVIDGLGLALEETLQHLHVERPSYDEFEQWILEKNGGSIDPECIRRINDALSEGSREAATQSHVERVLNAEQLACWEEYGYVVLHEAVSQENCRAAELAIWEFLGMNPDDPDTWYRERPTAGIMVQLFHHPAFSANRQSPRIHKAFAQIWGTDDLWVSIDRGSLNPPERADWKFPGPYLHWDISLEPPIPFGTQGLLYLTDTDAEQGAFRCVPGFHRQIEHWLRSQPPGADPRTDDLEGLGAKPISGKAGDLIIWHQALPHGASPNRSIRPRIVQYINMYPMDRDYRTKWK